MSRLINTNNQSVATKVKLSGRKRERERDSNEEKNRREISLPPCDADGVRVERYQCCRGGRDPKVGSEPANESGTSEGATGGYCLLGDLSSNTSRQEPRVRGMGELVGS